MANFDRVVWAQQFGERVHATLEPNYEVLAELMFNPHRQPTTRLSAWDFEPTDERFSQAGAQNLFLRAVTEVAPEVLDSLWSGPFTIFRKMYDGTQYYRRLRGESLSDEENQDANATPALIPKIWEAISSDQPEEFCQVKESLWTWSKTWNLDADWCRRAAFFTIALWLLRPDVETQRQWHYQEVRYGVPFEVRTFRFEWAWHPARTSRAAVERQMRALFEADMKQYLDKTGARFQEENCAVEAQRRKNNLEHFALFALFQVHGISKSDLLKQYPHLSSVQAIDKAVNGVSDLLGLELRANRRRRGRPRKS